MFLKLLPSTERVLSWTDQQGKQTAIMIILVDDRVEVTDAYRASFGREGISAASFTPVDFDNWFHSTSGPDLAAVEAFILGDFLQRENVTRAIKTRSEAPAIALNDSTGLETTLSVFSSRAWSPSKFDLASCSKKVRHRSCR